MEDQLNDEVFQLALTKWGEQAQVGMVIEECGEVLSAINKYYRSRIQIDDLIEEFVDVYIMMRQMRFMNKELFDKIYEKKVIRIKKRLGLN